MRQLHRQLSVIAPAFAFATSAAAQANNAPIGAFLFGVVDVSARAVRNGSAGTSKSESSDGLTSSRLGWRGTEDLGDGLKAGFWLEAGLAPDTGTTNAKFFNRRSTVSMIDPTFGEIRLGRDYTPLYTAEVLYDPFANTGLGSIVGSGTAGGTSIISALGSGSNTLTRVDNQLSYFLPANLGGVYGQLAVAPSEGTVGNKYLGGRLGFGRGAVDISAGYERTTVLNGNKFDQLHAGAAYDFGVAKLSGEILRTTWRDAPGGSRRQLVLQVGVVAPVGRQQLRADIIHGRMDGGPARSGYADGDNALQLTLGWQYNFSKRTAIYATAAQLRNYGASRLVLPSGRAGMRDGENSTGADLGLRHSF